MEKDKIYLECLDKNKLACIVYNSSGIDTIFKTSDIDKISIDMKRFNLCEINSLFKENRFLVTEKDPTFKKIYRRDLLIYSYIDKSCFKEHLLTLPDSRLVKDLKYRLRTWLKWRLVKLNKQSIITESDAQLLYIKIYNNLSVENNKEELVFGLSKNFPDRLLCREVVCLIMDLLKSVTRHIIKEKPMNPTDRIKELSKKLKTTNDPKEKEEIYKQMKRIQMFGVNSMYGAMSIHDLKLFNDIDVNKKKLYGIIKYIRIVFDNTEEISCQYYKKPIIDISIETVNSDPSILERRLNKIFSKDISFLVNDIIRYLKDKTKRSISDFQYTVENNNGNYFISFNTDSGFRADVLFGIREIEIK